MWVVFKKRDGEAVAASSLELKARGISYTSCLELQRTCSNYKLFWMGGKDRSDGAGMFVAEK